MKAITTKYIAPSNSKGSRISATDEDGNRVIIAKHFDTENEDQHRRAAEALCDKMKWDGKETLTMAGIKGGYVFIFNPLYEPLYNLVHARTAGGGLNGNPYQHKEITEAIEALTNGKSKYDLPRASKARRILDAQAGN